MNVTIRNARILDPRTGEVVEGGVAVRDGRITQVGAVEAADGGITIDAEGRTLIPGFIDAHFHAYAPEFDVMKLDSAPLSYVAIAGTGRLRAALERGFTTVRDVAGGDIGLARGIERGWVEGPRYLFSGGALSQTGGHGDPRHEMMVDCGVHGHMGRIADGVDEVRHAVRELMRTGSHCIKVMASGGVASPTDPVHMVQYTREELEAIVVEARRRDSYVAAHAYPSAAIRHAVEAGVRTIEHGNLLDRETADLMAEHGAYLVPTLIAYDAMGRRGSEVGMPDVSREKNAKVLEAGKKAIAIARDAGVRIGFGTDLMGELEDDQLLGLKLQAEVLGTVETIRAATVTNAEIIQRDDLGVIEEGAIGDLLLLGGDVLENPELLWSTEGRVVIQGGNVVAGEAAGVGA